MKPYILWFGDFKDCSLAQMMFRPDGYRYLKRFVIPKLGYNANFRSLVQSTRELLALGEKTAVAVRCSCGEVAAFIEVDDSDGGLVFGNWVCDKCATVSGKDRFRLIALKFSSLTVYDDIYAKRFAECLKKAFGLTGPITKNRAQIFFFGDSAEPLPVRKQQSVQLQLF